MNQCRKLHEDFTVGGEARRFAITMAGYCGGFSEGESANILEEVKRWALRDERKLSREGFGVSASHPSQILTDNPQAVTRHMPRPKGDEAYEEMSQTDRLQVSIFGLKLPTTITRIAVCVGYS